MEIADTSTMVVGPSGRMFSLLHPRHEDVHIEDIAWALSKLCRYTGHCRGHYSVAQHSVLVSRLVPRDLALDGLLHDAAEAYVGDIATPLKRAIRAKDTRGAFNAVIDRVELVVAETFGRPWPEHPLVKRADLVALVTEQRDLIPGNHRTWIDGIEPAPTRIVPWTGPRAERAFLRRFMQLTRKAAA